MNSQWDPVALSFQTQDHTTNLNVDDLFGKRSANGGLQKRKQKSKQVPFANDLALNIEKTLDYYHNGGEPVDETGPIYSMVGKFVRRFWTKNVQNMNSTTKEA